MNFMKKSGLALALLPLVISSPVGAQAGEASIGAISFYGGRFVNRNDFFNQGCNVDESRLKQLDYTAVIVSNGEWDNGAACGRKYAIRCISTVDHACKSGVTTALVVGYCSNCVVNGAGVTMKIIANRYNRLVQSRNAAYASIEYIVVSP